MDSQIINTLVALVGIAALAGLSYIYAGYPLLVVLLAKLARRPVLRDEVPRSLSILISAYDEPVTLPRKIENLLASDTASHIREILIGLDGSPAGTIDAVQRIADPRVKVFVFESRRGKPSVLNALAREATGELLVMADARQMFDPGTLSALSARFADPSVGVVSGELMFRAPEQGPTTAAEGVGFYWTYEKLIRRNESRFRGVPGATGACYAIRRYLFRPIPADTLLDDVLIPMQAVLAGSRCVFESQAIAWDTPTTKSSQESLRKRRTIAGNVQLVQHCPSLVMPWRNGLWWEFVSHKLLRLAGPFLLMVAMAANVWLVTAGQGLMFDIARVVLAAQVGCYAVAGWGAVQQARGKRSQVAGPFLMFATLNWVTLLACWDAARGRYRVTWAQAARGTDGGRGCVPAAVDQKPVVAS